MYRIIIVAGLLLACVLQAEAQVSEPPADSGDEQYKWEIGADMLWLFKKKPEESNIWHFRRNPTPYAAILRVHQDNGSAYRFRLGGHYQELLNPGTTLSGTSGSIELNTKTALYLFSAFGKEWEKRHGKFRFFYGSDVFVDYSFNGYERNIFKRNEFAGSAKTLSAGLSPLLGVQYFIHPRLSLSTETHLNVAYHWYKTVRLTGGDTNVPRTIDKENYFKADFLPFSTVNLNYHF